MEDEADPGNPNVEVAPSTLAGRPTGPPVPARAELLDGGDAKRAAGHVAACCRPCWSRWRIG